MAEYKGYFDVIADEEPNYDGSEHAKAQETVVDGVAYNYLNELEVKMGSGLQVIVDNGCLWSKGRFYIQDEPFDGAAPKTFAIDAATAGFLRKDRIVVEFDVDNQAVFSKLLKGTEAASNPAAPNLLDGNTKWHISLGIVNVNGGSITSIESERVIGNVRLNPNFVNGITAPSMKADSMTLKDGGIFYWNTAETAYFRFTDNAVYMKTPGCAEVLVAGLTYGTDASAPAGTYQKGTLYVEHEE